MIHNKVVEKLLKLKEGESFNLLGETVSKCAVKNGSCKEIISVSIRRYYFNEEDRLKHKDREIWICGIGCNKESCILNL